MDTIPFTRGLHQLTEHCWAWLWPDGGWCKSNSGLVAADGQALLVDTLSDLPHTKELLSAVSAALPGTRIRTAVNTHADGDHCWGNQLLGDAEIITSAGTAHEFAHGLAPEFFRQLLDTADPDEPGGRYVLEHFSAFDLSGVVVPRADRTYRERLPLSVGGVDVELIEVGPAHTRGDTVAWVPSERVLYSGDILFIGGHPVMWEGPIDNWIAACQHLEQLRPELVVPGHGPVTDVAGVADFRAYLEHVRAEATRSYTRGIPAVEAAISLPLGPWSHWSHPERLVFTISAVYRRLDEQLGGTLGTQTPRTPAEMFRLCGEIAYGLRRPPRLSPLPPADQDEPARAAITEFTSGDGTLAAERGDLPPMNVVSTLARDPELLPAWSRYTKALLEGSLPARLRELVILRTAWRCRSPYEWAQHQQLGRATGLTDADLARLTAPDLSDGWTEEEQATLTAVDELLATSTLTDAAWTRLRPHHTDAHLIELVSLVGHYQAIAMTLNAFRTPVDTWLPLPRLKAAVRSAPDGP